MKLQIRFALVNRVFHLFEEMEGMMDAGKFTEFKACDISSSIFRMGDFGKIMLFPQGCRRELGVVLQRHNLVVFSLLN